MNYLAKQLEVMGLEPAFNGSWYQPFEMILVPGKPDGSRGLTVSGKRKSVLQLSRRHNHLDDSPTKKIDLKKAGEYVFCGLGILALEYGWNDYEGRVVLRQDCGGHGQRPRLL